MTSKQLIEMACSYAGLGNNELGRRMGMSASLFSQRLKTGKFTLEEWQQIASALGADPESVISFKFPDGKEIK